MNRIVSKNIFETFFIVILIAILPVLRVDVTLDPNSYVQFVSLTLILTAFLALIYIQNKHLTIRSNKVLLFLGIYLGYVMYSGISVVVSNNFADALFWLSKSILYLFILLAFLFSNNSKIVFTNVCRSALVLGLVSVTPALLQLFNLIKEDALIIPYSTYNISSFYPHRNLLSEILLLSIPFGVYVFFMGKGFWKFMAGISIWLSFFILVVISNRAAWLGLAVLALLVTVLFFIKRKRFRLQVNGFIFAGISIMVFIMGLWFLIHYSESSSLKTHALNSLDITKGSTKDRVELWTRSIALIKEKPILGEGLGSWKINMLKLGNSGLVSENNTTFYQRPHNDFLWIAAEQGVIGLCFYLSAFAFVLWMLFKNVIGEDAEVSSAQILVILSASIVFLLFSVFSFPRERISHNILIFSSWGLLLAELNKNGNTNVNFNCRKLPFLIGSIGILLAILVVGYFRFTGDVHTKNAILAKKSGHFKKCISEISEAKSVFYTMDETSTPLTWYSGLSYFNLADYKKAAEELKVAVSVNPYHIYALNDYGSSLTKVNDPEAAKGMYQKAIEIAPNFLDAKLNLCAMYYKEGNAIKAFELLKTISINETDVRYQKTVSVILKTIIDQMLKQGEINNEFSFQYQNAKNNFQFYKAILKKAIQNNLSIDEIMQQKITL